MAANHRDLPNASLATFAVSVLVACCGAGWLLVRIMLNEPVGTWLVPALFTVWWARSAHNDWVDFVEDQRLVERLSADDSEQRWS